GRCGRTRVSLAGPISPSLCRTDRDGSPSVCAVAALRPCLGPASARRVGLQRSAPRRILRRGALHPHLDTDVWLPTVVAAGSCGSRYGLAVERHHDASTLAPGVDTAVCVHNPLERK